MNEKDKVYRGEVYYAELSPATGSEQGGIRPVLVVQNDVGNRHAPTTIVIPLTTKFGKHKLPTHVFLQIDGLRCESIALCEQVRTISKLRLRQKVGAVTDMTEVNTALAISLGLA